jgi:hypothetical protein
MVARAIDLLLARIADRARPVERKCLPNELVIRRSTARQADPGPSAAASVTRLRTAATARKRRS